MLKLVAIFCLLGAAFGSGWAGKYYAGGGMAQDADPEQCTKWYYLYDENQSPLGKSQCNSDCMCDGRRTCVKGCCSGWPRTSDDTGQSDSLESCLNPAYHGEENNEHTCQTNCDCDGNRFCDDYKYCHGTARYGEKCLDKGLQSQTSTLNSKDDTVKKGGCQCTDLVMSVYDYIVGDTFQQNDDICATFIDGLVSKGVDKICAGASLCSFLMDEVTDNTLADQAKRPIEDLCRAVLSRVEDFAGIQISLLYTKQIDQINNGGQKAQQFFTAVSESVCGDLLCQNNDSANQCSSAVINGVSFVTTACETLNLDSVLWDSQSGTSNGGGTNNFGNLSAYSALLLLLLLLAPILAHPL